MLLGSFWISVFMCRRGQSFSTTDAGQLPAGETRSRRPGEPRRRWSRHALRSLIHHRPARSEHKFALFTDQSFKQLLTFYASLNGLQHRPNLPCPSLKFGLFFKRPIPQTWHKGCTVVSPNAKIYIYKPAIIRDETPAWTCVRLSWTAF